MKKKKCFKCGEVKPLAEFYPHPQMADGRVNKCKECNKRDVRENREKNIDRCRAYDRERASLPHRAEARKKYWEKLKETGRAAEVTRAETKKYRESHPGRSAAYSKVARAIEDGRLIKQSCEVCGNKNSHAHHADYTKPLEVTWLCSKHHAEEHKKIRGKGDAHCILHP